MNGCIVQRVIWSAAIVGLTLVLWAETSHIAGRATLAEDRGVAKGTLAVGAADVVNKPSSEGVRQPRNELVRTLTVTLEIGPNGKDLHEPVALDLGLGYPLWLHPLGRRSREPARFGAVPQRATVTREARAVSRASFTFDVAGVPGRDVLRTTSQLLANTRISDISRVGIASVGLGNWELAAYEITINGQPFASSQPADATAQTAARDQLAGLRSQIVALRKQVADLEGIKNPNAADLQRLAQLDLKLSSLLIEENAFRVRHKLAPSAKDAHEAARLRLAQID